MRASLCFAVFLGAASAAQACDTLDEAWGRLDLVEAAYVTRVTQDPDRVLAFWEAYRGQFEHYAETARPGAACVVLGWMMTDLGVDLATLKARVAPSAFVALPKTGVGAPPAASPEPSAPATTAPPAVAATAPDDPLPAIPSTGAGAGSPRAGGVPCETAAQLEDYAEAVKDRFFARMASLSPDQVTAWSGHVETLTAALGNGDLAGACAAVDAAAGVVE